MTQIVDFSWGRPGASALRAAGVGVVIRYLTRDTTGKGLTPAEAESYRAVGIQIVGVFQDTASRALQGRAAGAADARVAIQQARDCGFEGYGTIYFAVDFDVRAEHLDAIVEYFRGVVSILPLLNVGIYGDYDAMERVRNERLASWFWQAGASSWSSGRRFPHADLVQLVGGPTIGGASVDYNERVNQTSVGEWAKGAQSMAGDDVRSAVEAELDEATAQGYHNFDDMFRNESGGIVAMLRALYNGVGLNRGINISDQVGLVGLAVSQVGKDLLALSAGVKAQLDRMEANQLKILSGIAALGGGTPLPDPVVDPTQFADAMLDALVERLSGGLAPRSLLVPRVAQAAQPLTSETPLGDAAARQTMGQKPLGEGGQT